MVLKRIPCGTPGAIYSKMRPSGVFKKPKNKFAGTCCICGEHVPAGAGGVEKSKEGKWDVMC